MWADGKAPPIGRLRNLAAIFEWSDTPVSGDPMVTPGYAPRGQCWCSLRPRGNQELLGAQINEAPLPQTRGTHILRTRFRGDGFWTIRHMLEIAGKRYRVVAVREDDNRRFVELEVEDYGDREIIGAPPAIPRGYQGVMSDEYAGHAD